MSKSVEHIFEDMRNGHTQVNEEETQFYTKAEVDALLKKKSDLVHDHPVDEITDFETEVKKVAEGKE